jgi:hypothetical protein
MNPPTSGWLVLNHPPAAGFHSPGDTDTPFVGWLYGVTAPLVAPFAKILPNWTFSGFVVDFATVAALIVFALAGSLLVMIFPYSRKEPAPADIPC